MIFFKNVNVTLKSGRVHHEGCNPVGFSVLAWEKILLWPRKRNSGSGNRRTRCNDGFVGLTGLVEHHRNTLRNKFIYIYNIELIRVNFSPFTSVGIKPTYLGKPKYRKVWCRNKQDKTAIRVSPFSSAHRNLEFTNVKLALKPFIPKLGAVDFVAFDFTDKALW